MLQLLIEFSYNVPIVAVDRAGNLKVGALEKAVHVHEGGILVSDLVARIDWPNQRYGIGQDFGEVYLVREVDNL